MATMTNGATIRIGTRGSALARWQAEHVADRLRRLPHAPTVELELIRTEGDRVQDVALSKLPGKAFFTKELEQAMLDGRTDLAVHSLKDVETRTPPGLRIGAVLEREDARDVLIARDGLRLESLPDGAVIGTSSLRRSAFLKRWRPDLVVRDLRGNVPTRIQKLDAGGYDAIVLAAAGVKRLGLESRISDWFTHEILVPAVSQGAIAVQLRSDDDRIRPLVAALDHAPTRAATTAERALLRTVEGGCQIPLGAHASIGTAEEGDDRRDPPPGELRLQAVVCSLDGTESVAGERRGPVAEAAALGEDLGRELLARGGAAILAGIRARSDVG